MGPITIASSSSTVCIVIKYGKLKSDLVSSKLHSVL